MQRSKLLYSLPLLLFFCLVLFLWRGLGIDSRLLPSALLNKPLPDFELADLRQPEHLIKKQAWLRIGGDYAGSLRHNQLIGACPMSWRQWEVVLLGRIFRSRATECMS